MDKRNLTQFGRAMHNLGIEMIPALKGTDLFCLAMILLFSDIGGFMGKFHCKKVFFS